MSAVFPWNYVVVEGVIGVGKTSLTRMLGERLKATTTLENKVPVRRGYDEDDLPLRPHNG